MITAEMPRDRKLIVTPETQRRREAKKIGPASSVGSELSLSPTFARRASRGNLGLAPRENSRRPQVPSAASAAESLAIRESATDANVQAFAFSASLRPCGEFGGFPWKS